MVEGLHLGEGECCRASLWGGRMEAGGSSPFAFFFAAVGAYWLIDWGLTPPPSPPPPRKTWRGPNHVSIARCATRGVGHGELQTRVLGTQETGFNHPVDAEPDGRGTIPISYSSVPWRKTLVVLAIPPLPAPPTSNVGRRRSVSPTPQENPPSPSTAAPPSPPQGPRRFSALATFSG